MARVAAPTTRTGSRSRADRQQILLCRELGFGLDEITALLDEPGADPQAHLRRQHALLRERIARLERMVAAVQTTMEAHMTGVNLTPAEKLEVFGDDDPERHGAEAQRRWGETEAWHESRRRTANYDKEDWLALRAEAEQFEAELAAALAAGEPADGERAMAAAEAARRHVERWFYPCSPVMHRGLAELYVADRRFAEHYERRATGLARYVHDAVQANASRQEGAG